MYYSTRAVFSILTDELIARDRHFYLGPILECKKGREVVDAAGKGANALGKQASGIATQDQALQSGYRGDADPFAKSLIATKPGELSSYAGSQYSSDKRMIDRNAEGNRQVGMRILGQRGFNGAPGATASLLNTSARDTGAAQTEAYNRAQQSTLGQGLAGINYMQGQQQIYDPNKAIQAGTGAYGTGADAGFKRSQMGSTFGDIGKGLQGIGQIAAAV